MKHFFNIERRNGAALVQIIEVVREADGSIRPGRTVQEYETASSGATKSARKAIRKLEAPVAEGYWAGIRAGCALSSQAA